MQIIESTIYGVRSAILKFQSDEDAPTFVLFPMIHVASLEFYNEISERMDQCDNVLCEGVNSPTVSLLTSSYRFYADSPRIGLVSQSRLNLNHMQGRLIHADAAPEDFEKRWSSLKFWLRIVIPVLAPLYGLYMKYFGTRSDVARGMGLNQRKSAEELEIDEDLQSLTGIIVDWRDQILIDQIDQQWRQKKDENTCIGILFGATHMRAVIRHLIDKRGYRIVKAEWATVFTL